MVLGVLIIKARHGLTDKELVDQIQRNPYLQFFMVPEEFQYSPPFDPSMMVYFRKRLPEAIVHDCNEQIVRHGLKVIKVSESHDPDNHSGSGGESISVDNKSIPPAQKRPNQGSLLIDATCAPVDIRHPTDLSLLNVDEVGITPIQ